MYKTSTRHYLAVIAFLVIFGYLRRNFADNTGFFNQHFFDMLSSCIFIVWLVWMPLSKRFAGKEQPAPAATTDRTAALQVAIIFSLFAILPPIFFLSLAPGQESRFLFGYTTLIVFFAPLHAVLFFYIFFRKLITKEYKGQENQLNSEYPEFALMTFLKLYFWGILYALILGVIFWARKATDLVMKFFTDTLFDVPAETEPIWHRCFYDLCLFNAWLYAILLFAGSGMCIAAIAAKNASIVEIKCLFILSCIVIHFILSYYPAVRLFATYRNVESKPQLKRPETLPLPDTSPNKS